MTQNPFDALGAGGFDMNALLEQATAMQQQIQQAQADLAERTFDGEVGGGAVVVTVNGLGELAGVRIRTGVVDGADEESLADLADLVIAAYRDARANADREAGQAMGPLAGELGLG